MRVLVDSHVLIWALDDPDRLAPTTTAVLREPDNTLLVSSATLWELGIKVGLEKLKLSLPFREWIERAMRSLDLEQLTITVDHAVRHASLPFHHRDPFDRLIAAQALVENIDLATCDPIFESYGVRCLLD